MIEWKTANNPPQAGCLAYRCVTTCAAMSFLTVSLEGRPRAYNFVLPAVIAILFSNIVVFLFMSSRFGEHAGILFRAVSRVCMAEGVLLLLLMQGQIFIGI
ncbi:MAG: hypothetical protein ACLU4B_03385 [Bilophila wadsworthia]